MFVKIVPLANAEKCRHYPRKNIVDRNMLPGRNIKLLFKRYSCKESSLKDPAREKEAIP